MASIAKKRKKVNVVPEEILKRLRDLRDRSAKEMDELSKNPGGYEGDLDYQSEEAEWCYHEFDRIIDLVVAEAKMREGTNVTCS